MKKSKQLMGIEIVDLQGGKMIGKISSMVFIPGQKKALGFTVDCGKWIKKQKAMLIKDVSYIGKDKIMVSNDAVLIDYDSYPEFNEALKEKERVFGLVVITNAGEELGYIEDIIIDEKKCSIEGYVLTDGIIEDILKGKTIIPFTDEIIFGKDIVIINENYKNVILKNDISLRKVFKKGRRLRY